MSKPELAQAIETPDYSTITNEELMTALCGILNESPAAMLLGVKGVYELLAEHFNNEVLDRAIKNRS